MPVGDTPRAYRQERARLQTIDGELRLSPVQWSIRDHGGNPSRRLVDELLDVRNADTQQRVSHRVRRSGTLLT